MLEGTILSIDAGAPLRQQPSLDTDTASSRATSDLFVPRLSTPDTEDDDDDFEEEGAETSKQPNMRSKTKVLVASSKLTTTPAISRRGSAAAGIADKRRERNLERNRAAASKCRQRKKKWQDGLEREKAELENLFKALHSESKDLMEEVTQLKNFVMAHAGCNDANIDDWIRNEADKFVRRMSTARAQMHRASAPPVSVVTGSMAQMQSLAQGSPAATLALNDALNSMFASPDCKAPSATITNSNNDLRPGVADTTKQSSNIFDQNLLMVSSMQV